MESIKITKRTEALIKLDSSLGNKNQTSPMKPKWKTQYHWAFFNMATSVLN